jgi:osmotically-inducible protein OsmY
LTGIRPASGAHEKEWRMMRLQEKIKKDIVDSLAWDDRVDASDVTVEVDGTRVRLAGTVPSLHARLAATTDAWNVREVTEVDNQIQVKYPDREVVPGDEEIARSIRLLITVNPKLDASDIEVGVDDGRVTLEGSVNAFWKKHLVENRASHIHGVRDVDNRLGIAPTGRYSDHEIAREVVEALDRNVNVSKDNLDVEVSDGIVTLWGTVPNRTARRAALTASRYTRGVRDVRDNMTGPGTLSA